MHPDLGVGRAHAQAIRAVRGPLSWKALRDAGVRTRNIPFGDPGYLAPSLLGIERAATTGTLGVVAHYTDRDHPIMAALLARDGVVDLNVHDDPLAFLRAMAGCAAVVSSSLHGLIFAEALGIRNLWIKAGDEIAGEGFKFHDWFATTRNPQASPRPLGAEDAPDNLAAMAGLSLSTIDRAALLGAFPHDIEGAASRALSFKACRARPMPVFLISFNRAAMLRRTIAGIEALAWPTEIVIHDNGSTDAETLALLDELEASGRRIFRRRPIETADELNNINESVAAFFADWAEPARYVVSDCDIDLSIAAPDALSVYDELLNRFRRIECVGPMLRIRDIPVDYPLYAQVMNRHIEQFWMHPPSFIMTSRGQVAVKECSIDTTFALHRAGESFRRLKRALRVYEPYEALHLDWYKTDLEDDGYALSSSSEISHWNNRRRRLSYGDVTLDRASFVAVRRADNGMLESFQIDLDPNLSR